MIGKFLNWIGGVVMCLINRAQQVPSDPEVEKEFEDAKRDHPPTSSSSQ